MWEKEHGRKAVSGNSHSRGDDQWRQRRGKRTILLAFAQESKLCPFFTSATREDAGEWLLPGTLTRRNFSSALISRVRGLFTYNIYPAVFPALYISRTQLHITFIKEGQSRSPICHFLLSERKTDIIFIIIIIYKAVERRWLYKARRVLPLSPAVHKIDADPSVIGHIFICWRLARMPQFGITRWMDVITIQGEGEREKGKKRMKEWCKNGEEERRSEHKGVMT